MSLADPDGRNLSRFATVPHKVYGSPVDTTNTCLRGSQIMNKTTIEPESAKPMIEPLALRKRSAARLLDISERTIERLLAAGKFPRPDAHAGRCPLWTPGSLIQWIAEGGDQR
jgi:hypothetical protein